MPLWGSLWGWWSNLLKVGRGPTFFQCLAWLEAGVLTTEQLLLRALASPMAPPLILMGSHLQGKVLYLYHAWQLLTSLRTHKQWYADLHWHWVSNLTVHKCFNCETRRTKLFPFLEEETENQQGSVLVTNTDLKIAEVASRLPEDMDRIGSLGIGTGAI